MTGVDTSSVRSVSPGAGVGNTCAGNAVVSHSAGGAVGAKNALKSSGTGSVVVVVWTGRGGSGTI